MGFFMADAEQQTRFIKPGAPLFVGLLLSYYFRDQGEPQRASFLQTTDAQDSQSSP